MPNFILAPGSADPADGAAQEIVAECGKGGALGIVLAVAMPAGGGLVKVSLVAHRLQLRRHLAGMARMHAVVAPAGRDQDRRVMMARYRVVIGRDLFEEFPVVGVVWIAVYGDPAGAGVQFRVTPHVDQRDRAKQR